MSLAFHTRMLLASLLAMVLAITLTLPTWHAVLALWLDDGTYSHGLLLLLVVIWLLATEARRRPWPPITPQPLWALPLALTMLLLHLAQLSAFDLLQRGLLLPLGLWLAATLLGSAWLWRLLFPALLLSLALPIWGPLLVVLQQLAILVVGQIMALTPIPVTLSGTHISIPSGTFEIAEGCGGLRYVLVAGAISLLWGHLYLRDYRVRLLYLGVALLIAMISNWLRILLLILIGHGSEMQHGLMTDHNTFGWYVFTLALLPMFWIGRQLPHRSNTARDTMTAPAPAPVWRARQAALLVLAALLLPRLAVSDAADSRTLALPLPPPGWQPVAAEAATVSVAGVDQQWRAGYRSAPHTELRLHVLWQERPDPDLELLDSGILRQQGWQQGGAPSACPDCLRLADAGDARLLRYRYLSGGRIWRSRLAAKLAQLVGPLSGDPGSGVLWIEGECRYDCAHFASDFVAASNTLIDDLAGQVK